MLQSVLIFVDLEVLFHLVISENVFDEFLVLLVLFLLFLFLGFLFGGLGFVFHDALVLEVFEFDQFAEFFALNFSYQDYFLEPLEILKFLSM